MDVILVVVQLFWFMGFPLIKNWLLSQCFSACEMVKEFGVQNVGGQSEHVMFSFPLFLSSPQWKLKGIEWFPRCPRADEWKATRWAPLWQTPELLQWLPQFLLRRLLKCQGSHSGPASALLQEGLRVTCHQPLSSATSPLSFKPLQLS